MQKRGWKEKKVILATHDHRDAHGRILCPVSQWWSRWEWCRRVYASHYREQLPVSVFLYLYPRLNSYGTSNTQANFPSYRPAGIRDRHETIWHVTRRRNSLIRLTGNIIGVPIPNDHLSLVNLNRRRRLISWS